MNFTIEGNNIYSTTSGDLVAVVIDGELKIQPGKNAMTPRIKEFWESVKSAPAEQMAQQEEEQKSPAEEEEEVNTHFLHEEIFREEQPKAEEKKQTGSFIADLPESSLPKFDFALGVDTPEFKAFCRKHKLTKEQVSELLRRVEKRG